MRSERPSTTVVFYDGYCGLCDRLVHFLLKRDTQGRLRFATLQGALAGRELVRAGHDPADVDTVLVIAGFGEAGQRVLSRSRAVLYAMSRLGGFWAALATAASLVPSPIADALYTAVARRRYRVFGRFDACPLPRPEWRERFLDGPAPPAASRPNDG